MLNTKKQVHYHNRKPCHCLTLMFTGRRVTKQWLWYPRQYHSTAKSLTSDN